MSSFTIPIIDVSAFAVDSGGDDLEERRSAAGLELRKACSEVGFCYIKGHGCPDELLSSTFQSLKDLFDLPKEVKENLLATNNKLYRGYNAVGGAHSCTPDEKSALPDLKQSFTLGAEGDKSPMHGPNQFPPRNVCPGFETTVRKYWSNLLDVVAVRLMRALASSLNLDLDYFCKNCDDPVAQMVMLRYPPNREARRGCGAHTDCGFLTILAQEDGTEGLEVRSTDGNWVKAPALPGTFVINLGDMAAYWSNDLYQSTEHRVFNSSSTRSRHSIPFFINLNFDCRVGCLPGCCNDDAPAKYPPVTAGEYIMEKLGLMHMMK